MDSSSSSSSAVGSWSCEACTYINPSNVTVCQMCDTPRPTKPKDRSQSKDARKGDEAEDERARRREILAQQAELRHAAEKVRGIGDPSKLQNGSQAASSKDAVLPQSRSSDRSTPVAPVRAELPTEVPAASESVLGEAAVDFSGTYVDNYGNTKTLTQSGCHGDCAAGWKYTVAGDVATIVGHGVTGKLREGTTLRTIDWSNGVTYGEAVQSEIAVPTMSATGSTCDAKRPNDSEQVPSLPSSMLPPAPQLDEPVTATTQPVEAQQCPELPPPAQTLKDFAQEADMEVLPEGCMTPSTALAMELSRDPSTNVEDPRFGKALTGKQLRQMAIYFEPQEPCSDTCAQKALNNLAQRSLFSIQELGQAEVAPSDTGWGVDLNDTPSSPSTMPTGFFDVEAVKRAAAQKGLEVVDIEPKANYRESELPVYLEGHGQAEDNEAVGQKWLKGFLVYDSRPGHARHFYAIVVLPGRQFAVLNSLEEDYGAQNRLLTEEELWEMHEHYANDFRSWVFRWYPVVSRPEAVSALQDILHSDDAAWTITDERAERVIKACHWQVPSAARRLLQDDVKTVLHRLRASLLVIPRDLAEVELEAVAGDVQKAVERLSQRLREQAASQVPEESLARKALNEAAWSVDGAVSVLELLGDSPPENLEAMSEILIRAEWNFDHALKLRKVLAKFADKSSENALELNVDGVAELLEACSWNSEEAVNVAIVQKGYARCPVPIVRTVLQRNDGDRSAAMEMLKDFRERVKAHVMKCAESSRRKSNFTDEDFAALAGEALDMGGWSPAPVLDHARRLTDFAIRTKAECALNGQPFVPAEHVIWALKECGESATSQVAARMILYGEDANEAAANVRHRGNHRQAPHGGKGGHSEKPTQVAKAKAKPKPKHDDDDSCSLM